MQRKKKSFFSFKIFMVPVLISWEMRCLPYAEIVPWALQNGVQFCNHFLRGLVKTKSIGHCHLLFSVIFLLKLLRETDWQFDFQFSEQFNFKEPFRYPEKGNPEMFQGIAYPGWWQVKQERKYKKKNIYMYMFCYSPLKCKLL